ASDPPDLQQLRAGVLATLSQMEDPGVIGEARTRFDRLRTNPEAFSPEMRMSVLGVIAENADAVVWQQLHDMALHAGSQLEKAQLYEALGATRNPHLAEQALQLSLTSEADITLRPGLIRAVAQGHFPDAAFEFVCTHSAAVSELLEPRGRSRFAPRLVARSGNVAMIEKLQAYTTEHIPADQRTESVAAAATIGYNAAIRSRAMTGLD